MGSTLSISKQFTLGGKNYAESGTVTAALDINPQLAIVPAPAGVLASGGTTTAGSVTMANASHGITTGQRVDVYWSGGSLIGATVGTVSGLTVPITATGTYYPSSLSALPANSTALVVAPTTQHSVVLTGNNVKALVHAATGGGTGVVATICYCNGSTVEWVEQVPTADVDAWYYGGPGANPLAGLSITQVFFSHSDTVNTVTVSAGIATN